MSSDLSEGTSPAIVRINELARELGVKAKAIVDLLPGYGVTEKKTHSSSIPADVAEKVRKNILDQTQARVPAVPAKGILASPPTVPSSSGRNSVVFRLPKKFTFHRGFVDFDYVLGCFDWSIKEASVIVDLTTCESANYQALALLIQYAWLLTMRGCRVTFKYGVASSGPTLMLSKMGALDWLQVLTMDGRDFGIRPGQMFALRRRADVQNTINTARRAIQNYKVGFPDYLSYIVSELLYNATEHGGRQAVIDKCQVTVPSIFQFGHYPAFGRLAFFFSDLGIGIKAHLEKAYPVIPTHQDAIIYALRPNVSGTFRQQAAYGVRNNAGMGLTYSSLLLKRLKGDMYIVSHEGLAHVSPEDVTTRSLNHTWPGTFVLINLSISDAPQVSLEDLLSDIRVKAETELGEAEQKEQANRFYVNIQNYFGKWAEDKDAAISFRDRRLLPAVLEGKKIELDFRGVETAPHSFLNALLATPVQRLGVKAYQWIHVHNAIGSIHEVIRTIFEDNLPRLN
jgi:hypothetical protein